MPRTLIDRVVTAVTEPLFERDKVEMRSVDALLAAMARKRRRPRRRSTTKTLEAPGKESAVIWRGFRSILCAVDFSAHSGLALQYAAAIAKRSASVLRVIYVVDPLLASAAKSLHDRQFARRTARELRAFIDVALPARAGRRLRTTAHVSTGDAADKILAAARAHTIDLVVVGTHGHRGLDRMLMGSTALSVLQRTSVPVLVVPLGNANRVGEVAPSWPGSRILAAIDLDGDAAATEVENSIRIARWFESSLLLVHVLNDIAAPTWLSADLAEEQRIRVAEAQRELDELAAAAHDRVKTDVHVTSGHVADEIAELAAAERAELLLTTLHDRRRWFGAKRGSISYRVLLHADSPVLACPPHWRAR
jgi:nucleotide-binding universal stress UspA family protein